MPVQIRNLLVVANITDAAKQNVPASAGSSSSNLNEETRLQIIEEAVQQVLEILERQKER
jgi:hypothetical protein